MEKTKRFLMIVIVAACGIFLTFTQAHAGESTLDIVKKRGFLNCVIGNSFVGFYTVDEKGNWSGMDIDICRSVAVARDRDRLSEENATGLPGPSVYSRPTSPGVTWSRS